MPAYKDEARKTWYCKFSYTDWTGKSDQKMKRGFPTKKAALAWERSFLERQQGNPDMIFQTLCALYMEDITLHLKKSTVKGKEHRIRNHMLPYFENRRVSEIKPADIRKWQGVVLTKELSPTYQKLLNKDLNTIFNFAKKYHGLNQNPCNTVKTIGKRRAGRMDFWTQAEFDTFLECVKKPETRLAYQMLFYTGMRHGEMMALDPNTDIDIENGTLTISKTYYRDHGQDITTSPKTDNSIRVVTIPPFLVEMIKEYMSHIYDIQSRSRLFLFTRSKLRLAMEQGCQQSGVKRIRLHDIRHSHVSMLIEMGFSPLLIAERIGDTVEMVNNIYGHLYPNKHRDVADALAKSYQNRITGKDEPEKMP